FITSFDFDATCKIDDHPSRIHPAVPNRNRSGGCRVAVFVKLRNGSRRELKAARKGYSLIGLPHRTTAFDNIGDIRDETKPAVAAPADGLDARPCHLSSDLPRRQVQLIIFPISCYATRRSHNN